MEAMGRGGSGASVLGVAERKKAQRDAIDCVITQNHSMVVKIAPT